MNKKDTDERYILFMGSVSPNSTERLFGFVEKMNREGAKRINLLINSEGGSVSHGLAIYNFLKNTSIEIFTYNLGVVDSIGVVVYCAGGKRFAAPHSRFLVHPVRLLYFNESFDWLRNQEVHNILNSFQKNIEGVIAEAIGKTTQETRRYINNRKTFDSEEAKEIGLVDEIKLGILPSGVQLEIIKESEAYGDKSNSASSDTSSQFSVPSKTLFSPPQTPYSPPQTPFSPPPQTPFSPPQTPFSPPPQTLYSPPQTPFSPPPQTPFSPPQTPLSPPSTDRDPYG